MDDLKLKLINPPIVEAVLDIDCDFPPTQQLSSLEASARAAFLPQYPKFRSVLLQKHQIEVKIEPQSRPAVESSLHAFQFLHDDEKQLVQFRTQGYSFNRLAPYVSLDGYMPEIERTWRSFVEISSPVQVRVIRLRYINRLRLPAPGGGLLLEEFLNTYPRFPDENRLTFVSFFNQNAAIETASGNQLNIILATQPPENEMLPVILDITTASSKPLETSNWEGIAGTIQSLRHLKNRVFRNTLTEKCLNLYQS